MNRVLQFDSPFLLGFEHTRSLIERAARAAQETYPPYNVEEVGADRLCITLAVAGFSAEELEISLADRQLTIAGKREGDGERAFLHRGIAARAFSRAFVLADGMDVEDARLENGLLHVTIVRPKADQAVRRIPIRTVG